MDPRPGFMLFGCLITPGPIIEPPAPPQPHQPTSSSSHDSFVKPNNDNLPIPHHPAVIEDDLSLVENTKKAKRLVVKLNGQLFSPPQSVAKPNSVKEDDPIISLVEMKKKPVIIERLVCKLNGKPFYPETKRGLLSPQIRRVLVSMGVAEDHNPIHFFSRSLFPSDVEKGLTRLTIPKTQLLRPFLTVEEEALLQERGATRKLKRLEVDVVDPSLIVRTLSLYSWNYKKSDAARDRRSTRSWSYALNGGWMDLVKSNGLTAGDTLQVWSFRKNNASLGFIIFKEDRRPTTATATAKNDHDHAAARNPVIEGGSSSSSDHTDKDKDKYGSAPTWGKKRERGSSSSLSTMTTA